MKTPHFTPAPLETDPQRVAQLARARRDEFEVLRYTLEFMEEELPDDALDALVEEIAAPITAAVDCTLCANCCRSLDVYLTPQDTDRLAEGLHVSPEDVLACCIDRGSAEAVGEWGKLRDRPCRFLEGRLCTIYDHRPQSCRTYPALTPDFRWTLADTLEGAAICPIIYNVLDRLITVLESGL